MWQLNTFCRWSAFLVGFVFLATGLSLGQEGKWVWGKRIWERKVDDHRKIVVDERGIPNEDPQLELTMPQYYWRLLDSSEEDGKTLFIRPGSNPGSGVGPRLSPIEVLYTDLVNGDLLTVYNQDDLGIGPVKCWAFVVHTNPDGGRVQHPDWNRRSTTRPGLVDNSIGPAMKTAQMEKKPDGTLLLTVTDKEDKTHKFQMRPQKDNSDEEHWEPVEEK